MKKNWMAALAGPFLPDAGLLFARVAGALLVLHVHGLPKLLHFSEELAHIDDPLRLGRAVTLYCALFAELLCPLLVAAGLLTRLACHCCSCWACRCCSCIRTGASPTASSAGC